MVSMPWRLVICFVVLCGVIDLASGKCPPPPPQPRVFAMLERPVNGTEFDRDTVVIYKCRIGYHIATGNGRSTCVISDGTFEWTAPTMKCNPITCPEPERLLHGQVIGTEYSFGKVVGYKCHNGYIMWRADDDSHPVIKGEEPERECTADGQWNGATPICKPVQCDTPEQSIENGHATVSTTEFMGIVSYSCDPGYQIKGTADRRCSATGTWSGKVPECIEIQCLDPDESEFKSKYPGVSGRLHISVEPGHLASFSCLDGTGATETSTCTNTGKMGEWVPQPPRCVVTPPTTVSTDPEVIGTKPPSEDDPPVDDGLPTWVVVILVIGPVTLVSCCVVAFLWKRSKRQHQRIPTKDEKNGDVDLPVMSANAHQV